MRMKKWRTVLLAGLMGTCFAAGAYAEDVLQQVQAYLRPDFNVQVDGSPVKLSTPPLVYNDKSYLALTDISNYLGANVYWKEQNKTIYINSRNQAQRPNDQELVYEEIKLANPSAYMVEYLGGQFPLLTCYIHDNSKLTNYYRLTDVKRMGIDTDGLKKVRDKYTQWLFVSEDELSKKWKSRPSIYYSRESVNIVTTEKNAKKLESIRTYVKDWTSFGARLSNCSPTMCPRDANNFEAQNVYYNRTWIIMDVAGEDEYNYLINENGHLYILHLKLTKAPIDDGTYLISSSKEDIQAIR
ncbi:hypothetical protein PAECIP111802_03462 [Paenibacillus allorhizosphaerae]|uniref:Copper amine oxidase-like N-terminal domain-containing protein n=2 Tax=Paenibacillus allorhizosphaerae TaxID=2849866 RepID=A0ABN7TPK1_9BACL|nr:hypothetical protein PAECIP111802_03462 [Paenibacillus allorhizosphaerae]